MNYAIAETALFHQLGFNTDKWRKSLDGMLALVHYDMVEEALKNETDYGVYRHDDEAFREVMMSSEWSEQLAEE